MNALNQIIIEGNVVRQPEKREVKNGLKICTIPLAVNRRYKNSAGQYSDEVSFFDITAFGNLADACEKWCPKGRGIRVVGRLKQDSWTSEDGKHKSKVHVIAEHIEFKPLFKKNENSKETASSDSTSSSADSAPSSADSSNNEKKKKKLAMLAEVAAAAQNESDEEDSEEITF